MSVSAWFGCPRPTVFRKLLPLLLPRVPRSVVYPPHGLFVWYFCDQSRRERNFDLAPPIFCLLVYLGDVCGARVLSDIASSAFLSPPIASSVLPRLALIDSELLNDLRMLSELHPHFSGSSSFIGVPKIQLQRKATRMAMLEVLELPAHATVC